MIKTAGIYARVSSDRQKENHTITSQVAELIQYAQTHQYVVLPEWHFQDEGYSGATLLRPGLEALRDVSAAGQLQAVLIYSPDRLSRKYAYQVLLIEELSRCGVEVVFLKSPSGATPEDQLLLQFQGMIAEYERAQIAERSRRGKRHRAQMGTVNVLSGAPYGYRYVKKTESSAAYYEVIEAEAKIVRMVFDLYTRQMQSINAIARLLNQQQIPTRTSAARWERSTVWGMLRNPAYQGRACFGKTEIRPRQRITRPLRQRNGIITRNSASHERPCKEWIEIPVPALISAEVFGLAQEQLESNKRHSPRRTIEPTLLQGMLVCQRCGYALYRTSTRTSLQKIYYYRCLGSDAYRHLKGALCNNRPIRQDYLDSVVWTEVVRLLENPNLIQAELNRRLETAKNTDPVRQRFDGLQREQVRLANRMERLVTAYQEELINLDELRRRIPELRKQQQAVESEMESLDTAAADQTRYLHLVDGLADFANRLRDNAIITNVLERQKILRLLVKEVLVSDESITIRHSIPLPQSGLDGGTLSAPKPLTPQHGQNYLLRSGSNHCSLRRSSCRRPVFQSFHDALFKVSP
jgi:site-specific DNA recombinase